MLNVSQLSLIATIFFAFQLRKSRRLRNCDVCGFSITLAKTFLHKVPGSTHLGIAALEQSESDLNGKLLFRLME